MSYGMLMAQRQHFISYSVKNGLAQSQVRDIIQSKNGYLWIATIGGVSRFDGKNFTNYNKSNGLLNNVITAIDETEKGEILIACQGGMVIIEGTKVTRFPFTSNFEKTIVFDIAEIDNEIYLSTNGSGLLKWNYGEIQQIKFDSPNENFIRTLQNIDGKLAMGSKSGLSIYDGKQNTTLIKGISVNKIAYDGQQWWIATTKHGAIRIEQGDTTFLTQIDGITSLYQKDVTIDKNGNPWLISKNGIVCYDNKSGVFNPIRSTTPHYTENLKVIFCDRDGNMWVGTSGYGILKYTGPNTLTYTLEDGLSSDQIMSFAETSNGTLWMATYGDGVMYLDQGEFGVLNYEDGLRNNTVWSIESVQDEVWIGTSDGINIFSNGKLREFKFNDSLPFVRVSSIFYDSEASVWIGTRDGLIRFKNGELTTPLELKQAKLGEVKSFCQIRDQIWISSNKGAFSFNLKSKEIEILNEEAGLGENYVSTLCSDPLNNLWLGTDDGIYHYETKTGELRHYHINSQPSSNIVTFVSHDSTNSLWVGTDNGLFSINTTILSNNDSLLIRSYNEHDGIISQECNQNAAFCDRNGNLWFGINGALVNVVSTLNPSNNKSEYGSVLKELQVNFETIDPQEYWDSDIDKPAFPYRNNRFTFKYAAIQFSNPEKVKYSYRLIGSDEEWSPEIAENSVTYANLSPGNYEFEIRSKLENEPWGSSYTLLSFKILPPFYLTWWFLLVVMSFLFLTGYLINRVISNQRLRKRELIDIQNRARILGLEQENLNAHMNRHFIFNALNSIQYYINTQEKKLANTYLTKFAALVRKNLDSAQAEAISLQEEIERLKLYLHLEQMRFKDRFEYFILLDKSIDADQIFVPSMILQPFIENSIMHGILPSEILGRIDVNIELKNKEIVLEILDNGVGIETSIRQKTGKSLHVSNGMKITRQRLEVLKDMTGKNYEILGPDEITNASMEVLGTKVTIKLPITFNKNLY